MRNGLDSKEGSVSAPPYLHLAGEEGFEPSLTDPESAVLPLDDSPAQQIIAWAILVINSR